MFLCRIQKMDFLKQLAPYYRRYEELSVENLNEADFICTSRAVRTCSFLLCLYWSLASFADRYDDLSQTLSETMKLASKILYVWWRTDSDIGSMTEEQFNSSVTSLFSSIPQPPIHTVASGSYANVSSVPPDLLCDSYTLSLYEM